MKNIQLFKPEMILMVPLMIETIAKKLEENTILPPKLVKNAVFGKQLTKISSGGAIWTPPTSTCSPSTTSPSSRATA